MTKLHPIAGHIPGTPKQGGAAHWRGVSKAAKAPHVGPPEVSRGPGYTHDPRYQCGPSEQPFGAGFAAVGIGRDVTTGGAW